LLDLDHPLVLSRLAAPLLLLVLILPEVHDPADGRHRGRRDLDQVEPLLTRNGERLRRRHDSELLAGLVDDPNLANPDAFVDADTVITSGRAIVSDKILRY